MGDFMNWLPAVLGVLALLFAAYLIRKVGKAEPGTERMQEIAGHIHQGAKAFLMAEYRILVIFVVILFVAIGFGIRAAVRRFGKRRPENGAAEKRGVGK